MNEGVLGPLGLWFEGLGLRVRMQINDPSNA